MKHRQHSQTQLNKLFRRELANFTATELELIPPPGSVPSPLDEDAVAGLRELSTSINPKGWAVDRLTTPPGRLVSILSNSSANGMEFNCKCAEICQSHRHNFEQSDFRNVNYLQNSSKRISSSVSYRYGPPIGAGI